MSAEGELQTAIYSALVNTSTASMELDFVAQTYNIQPASIANAADDLQDITVYAQGDVDDNARGLYVVLGNDTMIEWDTDCETGFEGTVTIHAWDTTANNRSFIPVKDVMGDVYAILHRAELSITGYNTVGMDFEFSETLLDPDGLTRHGVQRFRVLMRA